jgi:hypothetical protein
MALDRATLMTEVGGELAGVLALAKLSVLDDVENLSPPLNRTFRAMGVAETDLATAVVATGQEQQAIAYATFFILDRALRGIPKKMDVSGGGSSAKLSNQWDHLRELRDEALLVAQGFGLDIAGAGESGWIPIPYAGGVSESDYLANREGDRLEPLFQVPYTSSGRLGAVYRPELEG